MFLLSSTSFPELSTGAIVVIIIAGLISSIITGLLSKSLHGKKGLDGGFWIGFLLGTLGVIYAAGLPSESGNNSYTKSYGSDEVIKKFSQKIDNEKAEEIHDAQVSGDPTISENSPRYNRPDNKLF